MSGVLYDEEFIVPADATTLEGFRRWRRQLGEAAPKVHSIDGDLWFDMSPQSYRSHLPVVTEIGQVLSSSSVGEDRALERKYAQAGVREYWQVDARRAPLLFRLLRLEGDGGYAETAADGDGFLRSPVWGLRLRLRQVEDRLGQPDYRLDVR